MNPPFGGTVDDALLFEPSHRYPGKGLPATRRALLVSAEAVAQTLGVIDFLYIHDKATISEGAFSVAESPVRPPEALL
jgi:hypothetical protein